MCKFRHRSSVLPTSNRNVDSTTLSRHSRPPPVSISQFPFTFPDRLLSFPKNCVHLKLPNLNSLPISYIDSQFLIPFGNTLSLRAEQRPQQKFMEKIRFEHSVFNMMIHIQKCMCILIPFHRIH